MKKEKYKNRIAMAMTYMGSTPLFLLIGGYLVFYYTNVIGLNPGAIGTILLISRVLDGASDLVFGNVIDRTRSKMGVCRPWILSMTIGSMAGIIALLCVPDTGEMVQYIYVFISYNLANTVISTIYQLSAVGLPTYITRDVVERSYLYIWANTGQMITQIIISGCMFSVIAALGEDRKAWLITFLFIGIVGSVLTAVSVFLCREGVNPDDIAKKAGNQTRVSFVKALCSCLRNKYWWMLLTTIICVTAVNVSTMTMTSYYSQYILKDVTRADVLNIFYTMSMMVVPLIAFFIEKTEKRNIALAGVFLIVIGCTITVAVHTKMPLLCLAAVLKGLGVGCITAVSSAMIADTIEYGQWKTGVRNQAVLIGAQSAGTKIGQGLISAILSWAIAFAGFDALKLIQPDNVNRCIIRLYSILPLAMAVIAIFILLRYDLDKRFPDIMKDLENRGNVIENKK